MPKTTGSSTYRLITAAIGLLFAVVGVVILFVSNFTIGPVVTAAVIIILGIDAVVSSYRNKPSLLSRIGPLP